MLVRNWMSKKVITIDENDSMQTAMKLLKAHDIRMLPVMKGDKLVGVLTDRDIKRASASDATALEIHEQVLAELEDSPRLFEIGGRKVLVSHREEDLTEELGEQADLIVVAHTHRSQSGLRGRAALLNPGEVGGWLTNRSTIALVELDNLEAELVEL